MFVLELVLLEIVSMATASRFTRALSLLPRLSRLQNLPGCSPFSWMDCPNKLQSVASCGKQLNCLRIRSLGTSASVLGTDDQTDKMHRARKGNLSSVDASCNAETVPLDVHAVLDSTVDLTNAKADEGGECKRLEDNQDEVVVRWAAVLKRLDIPEVGDIIDCKVLASCTEDELFDRMGFLIALGVTGKRLLDLASLNPSVLTMDIVKGLTSVVECIESFGLNKSVLGETLVLEPGLLELLTERSLEDRIRALQDQDFCSDDIAAFLKALSSRKLLGRFLRLPVDKLGTILTFVTNVTSKSDQAIKLLKTFPTILFRDIEQDFNAKTEVLKSIVDDLKKVRKIFTQLPELLGRKTEAMEETILYLKGVVEDDKELKKVIETSPIVLTYSKKAIQQVSEYLQSVGFVSNRAAALIADQPYLITCDTKRLQKHVEFLKSKDLDENAICTLLENSTDMFFRSLERRLAPKIKFLENQGITGQNLQKLLKSRPQICNKSVRNSMAPNLKLLLDLGFQENTASLRGALKVTLPHSCKSMQSRICYLVSLGIEQDKVHKIVRENPSVLVMTDAGIKKRVDFLVKTMKRSAQELVACPSYFIANLENMIKPRVRVLEWLKSQGLGTEVSLSTLVEMPEESFAKQFVEPHPQVSCIYRGTSQQR